MLYVVMISQISQKEVVSRYLESINNWSQKLFDTFYNFDLILSHNFFFYILWTSKSKKERKWNIWLQNSYFCIRNFDLAVLVTCKVQNYKVNESKMFEFKFCRKLFCLSHKVMYNSSFVGKQKLCTSLDSSQSQCCLPILQTFKLSLLSQNVGRRWNKKTLQKNPEKE